MNTLATIDGWTRTATATAAALLLACTGPALAQVPVDDQGNPLGTVAPYGDEMAADGTLDTALPLTAAELETLVGPVALYPDDLLAIVLPASTYPLQIVQAARFLEDYEADPSLEPDEEWDESVTALLNYPEVLRMMNDDIDWTWRLGEAVVSQQEAVVGAVEAFRDRAYAAGNLKSDSQQRVSHDDGIIEIVPIDDEIIYVPYYEPARVIVRQVEPVYFYYPRPYPVYYYPYPVGYSFYSDYFWGVTTAFRIGWVSHHLHTYHHSYWGHPYYGHSYYGHYYRRPSIHIYNSWYVNRSVRVSPDRYRDGDYWQPRHRAGDRPDYYQRTRSYRAGDLRRPEDDRASTSARSVRTRNDDRLHTLGAARQHEPDRDIRFRDRPERNLTGGIRDLMREQASGSATSGQRDLRQASGRVDTRNAGRDAGAARVATTRRESMAADSLRRESAADGAIRRARSGQTPGAAPRSASAPPPAARTAIPVRTERRAATPARSQVQTARPARTEQRVAVPVRTGQQTAAPARTQPRTAAAPPARRQAAPAEQPERQSASRSSNEGASRAVRQRAKRD